MRTVAIIVAAGRGTRMGGSRSKIALPIAGLAMLIRAVRAFASHPRIDDLIVVGNPREVERILGPEMSAAVTIVPGGERRQDSVRAGLERVGEAEMVLVHDAARPLVPADVIDRVLREAARSGAAIPGLSIDDTVKRLAADGSVGETVPREGLILAQTPQGF
ncbi:MAG: 2-C-methyl-D-erythritol 4-phosphate cytidylyltransferase, partial [Acidobacteria bacterium]|nr:2-C-methyl-D-erythritol 4-phosphate cytidylyltransferase [Acidobacteriota bacterium]